MVRGNEGASEEADREDVEFAGREEDNGRADDKASNGRMVEVLFSVAGRGGCDAG